METNPLFSVIIPTYNRASLLRRAIQSVCHQTYENWELLVMDDGSADNTEQTAKAFPDSRIHYHKLKHGERSTARNLGIQRTCGKYICFLDDDDIYNTDYLRKFFDYYEKNNFPDIILRTGYYRVAENKQIKTILYDKKKHRNPVQYAAFHFCGVWSLSIPKTFLYENNFQEEFPHWQDTHLILRLFARYPFAQLAEYQYYYHLHPDMGSRKMGENIEAKLVLNLAPIRHLFTNYGDLIDPFLPDYTKKYLLSKKYLEFSQVALHDGQFSIFRRYLLTSLKTYISYKFWRHYGSIVRDGIKSTYRINL